MSQLSLIRKTLIRKTAAADDWICAAFRVRTAAHVFRAKDSNLPGSGKDIAEGEEHDNVVLAVAMVSWAQYTRIVRAKTQSLYTMAFVETVAAFSKSDSAIMFRAFRPTSFHRSSFKNVSINYQVEDGCLSAVHDVSFSVRKGEFFVLAGESGCDAELKMMETDPKFKEYATNAEKFDNL